MKILKNEKEIEEYLNRLSASDLVDFYKTAATHEHYCPMRCRCFDYYNHKVSSDVIGKFIENKIK